MYDDLKRDAVHGVGWSFFSSTSVRVLQIIGTLTLAKLLMPADFGVFQLASIITNAMAILPELGFAQVLIYQRDDIKRSANTAFVLSLVTGALLSAIVFAGAPLAGRLFHEPAVVGPLRIMSLSLVVSSLAYVHFALLDKDLGFKRRAVPEVAGALVYAIVAIVLAAIGLGVWSMVIAWIAMSVTTTAAMWLVHPWRPTLELGMRETREIVSYGKHLVVATLAAFLFLQIDKAAVGRWLGVTALGFYGMAFTVCSLPATNLTAVVNRVMFPTYARLREDLPEIRLVYLQTIKHICAAALPAAAGIVVLSAPIIRLLYGQKWVPAIPLFGVLAFYGVFRAIGGSTDAVFMAIGRPELVRRRNTVQLLIGGLLVYPAARMYGVVGVAVLFTTAYLTGMLYGLLKVQETLEVAVMSWVTASRASAIAALLAGLVGMAVADLIGRLSWFSLASSGLMLSAAYIAAMFVLDRQTFREIRRVLIRPGREYAHEEHG